VLGLSFRPDTNDMRESPAIPIVKRLLAEGASVNAYDPVAREEALRIFGAGKLRLDETLEAALQGAEAVVLVTRWKEFNRVPALLAKVSPSAVLVDGRRMLAKTSVPKYEGIGL
jgi:UDPglucose 6-dehydrogenase